MHDKSITYAQVVHAIVATLEQNIQTATQAAKDAHFAATHAESVAETKYDTFGLESSYLAQGQQRRVDELNQALAYFVQLSHKTDKPAPQQVELLTLVELACEQFTRHFFVSPHCGGLNVNINGISIMVVTLASSVGKSLINKRCDDEVEILVKGQPVDFDVVGLA